MNRFISDTKIIQAEKLKALGKNNASELYENVPEELRLREPFTLPEGLSEYDLKKVMQNLAGRNISASDAVCFMGAGAYDHFIPSLVQKTAANAAFELNGTDASENQNILQIIYEYEEFLKRLTGMSKVSTAFADVADALCKAITVAKKNGKGDTLAFSRALDPQYKNVIKTVAKALDLKTAEAKCDSGDTDFSGTVADGTLAVIAQSPNFFGIIEDMKAISETAEKSGALFISVVDPLSLALFSSPGEYEADIAIGNCRPLGGTLSYGSPFVAFVAVSNGLSGELSSVEYNGKYAFGGDKNSLRVIPAVTSAAYISLMGTKGLTEVARKCYSNAIYTYEKLTATSAFKPLFNKPFFREFAVKAVKKNVNDINNRMLDYGMIGGYALKSEFPEVGNSWLVAVTEKRSADEVELFVKEASRSI